MMLRKERMDAMVRSEVERFSSSSAPGPEGHREGAGVAGAAGGSKEEADRHVGSFCKGEKKEAKKKAEASGPGKAAARPGKKGKKGGS